LPLRHIRVPSFGFFAALPLVLGGLSLVRLFLVDKVRAF
jgi:hypothetical protein